MTMTFAKLRRVDGDCVVRVGVEVMASTEPGLRYKLLSPPRVKATDGQAILPEEIEAACVAGAERARSLLALDRRKIVVRTAQGRVSRADLEGFAVATFVAIARAVSSEPLIPEAALTEARGTWEQGA